MSIKGDVINFVTSDLDLSALFGTRVSPEKLPPGTAFPYLEVTDLGETAELFGGAISAQPYLATPRFQLSAFCEGAANADTAANLLRDKFDPSLIPLSDGTARGCYREMKTVMEEDQLSENQIRVHQAVLRYRLLAEKTFPQ
jgi:hypothetical protein